ncbi:hypothetical protein Bphy_4507 [Paraburkholderia phymatum STM815]|uniref:Uncharacterized protein n=1 Tax=Paraburkholderia phymatum (strain DSM 17167 / CIP 108236 / LMG 21445 / STM815) TaxID=391038 RepID=B2JQS9_PARP8|nr:hypothetical protein Bphy_4507 [Paraburkholderia phymatum STM815]
MLPDREGHPPDLLRIVHHALGSIASRRPHVSEFPERQVAIGYSQSHLARVDPAGSICPALPFAAILRRSFDRYVPTGLPPTHEGEQHVAFFCSLSARIPHIEHAYSDAATNAGRTRDALSLSLRHAVSASTVSR